MNLIENNLKNAVETIARLTPLRLLEKYQHSIYSTQYVKRCSSQTMKINALLDLLVKYSEKLVVTRRACVTMLTVIINQTVSIQTHT